jgi:hypothetical protein
LIVAYLPHGSLVKVDPPNINSVATMCTILKKSFKFVAKVKVWSQHKASLCDFVLP